LQIGQDPLPGLGAGEVVGDPSVERFETGCPSRDFFEFRGQRCRCLQHRHHSASENSSSSFYLTWIKCGCSTRLPSDLTAAPAGDIRHIPPRSEPQVRITERRSPCPAQPKPLRSSNGSIPTPSGDRRKKCP